MLAGLLPRVIAITPSSTFNYSYGPLKQMSIVSRSLSTCSKLCSIWKCSSPQLQRRNYSKFISPSSYMHNTYAQGIRKAYFSSSNIASGSSVSAGITTGDKVVGYWLLACSGMVASMVAVGGLTRLTASGLSMTDWKPQGSLPPRTLEAWMEEFEKYKKFPQWSRGNINMTLSEFKYIYYWEWGHRMLGRVTGMVFMIPLIGFGAAGMIRRNMWPRFLSLGALGGLQGLIGWWMVQSGLDTKTFDFEGENKEARVNPYRLATHLSMAFCLYAGLIWTSMDHLRGFQPSLIHSVSMMPRGRDTKAFKGPLQKVRQVKGVTVFGTVLLGITVLAGAFVAGNDAGRAYNTFPLMDGSIFPPIDESFKIEPIWRNFVESTALTQWNHRVLVTMATLLVLARRPNVWKVLSPTSRRCIVLLAGGASSLGVCALLNYVPVHLGSMHQCGALTLWTIGIIACHSLRPLRTRGGFRLYLEQLIQR